MCDREGDICVKVKKWMIYFVNVTVTCFFEGNLLELKKSALAEITETVLCQVTLG